MTPSERFQLLLGALTLIFMVMAGLLGFIIRITVQWTRTQGKLGTLVDEVRELIIRKDKDHEAIRNEVAGKQAAGDRVHDEFRERLTWLERRELDQRRRADGRDP